MNACAYCLHAFNTERCQFPGSDWCRHERHLENVAHTINVDRLPKG